MIINDSFTNSRIESVSKTEHHSADCETARFYTTLNLEHEFELINDGNVMHSFICSPSNLGELAAGWLAGEGYSFESVDVSSDGTTAAVSSLKKNNIDFIPKEATVTPFEMHDIFENGSEQYSRSHGIHECALKCGDSTIIRTDIGRFNAVDKAIGAALNAGLDLSDSVLFTSGRITSQLVKKVLRCGIPTLMSKSVITTNALDAANAAGLNIFFSVKFNSYLTP